MTKPQFSDLFETMKSQKAAGSAGQASGYLNQLPAESILIIAG